MEFSVRDGLTVSDHHSAAEQDDSHGNSRESLTPYVKLEGR